jgi:hypothetical protein
MRLPTSRGGRRRATLVLACVALLAPRSGRAASPESVPVSPEAALTAGAVLASDDPGGGGWYNPASLAAVKRSSIQVGASAYSESATVINDAAQVRLPWGSESGDIRSLRYSSVPSVLSYSFKLRDGVGLSLGVWTPYHDYDGGTVTIASSGPYPPALTATYAQTYGFSERRDDTWAGAAIGWQATPRLRIGAMLQGAYSTDVWTLDVNTSLTTSSTLPLETGSHLVYSERGDQGVIGLRTLFGMQLQVTERLRIASAVRGPTLRLYAWGPVNKFLTTAALLPNVPPNQSQIATVTKPGRGVSAVEPVRLYFGSRYAKDRWTLAVEGDWHPGLDGQFGTFKEGWNVRVGGTWRVNQDLLAGLGVFHDASSAESSPGRNSLKYSGFSGGVMYRPSAMVKALKDGGNWDLLTCVAVRGAYGWGTYRGIALSQLTPAPSPPEAGGILTFPSQSASVIEGSIAFFTAIIF